MRNMGAAARPGLIAGTGVSGTSRGEEFDDPRRSCKERKCRRGPDAFFLRVLNRPSGIEGEGIASVGARAA